MCWRRVTRLLPAAIAWLLLIVATAAFYYFVVPGVVRAFGAAGAALCVCEAFVAVFVVSNFLMATVLDPGVLPRATKAEAEAQDDFRAPLYRNVEIGGITVRMKWCVTCHLYRPPRCSHCSVCDHCIDTFDHHCPWVNNCVGRRNYRFFFVFLLSLTVHIVYVFGLCLLYTLHTKDELASRENVASIALMCIAVLLFVPILGLTGFHAILVTRGRTTNEQVTGKFRSGYNPFTIGCRRNVVRTLFQSQYPAYLRRMGSQLTPEEHFRHDVDGSKSADSKGIMVYVADGHSAPTPISNSSSAHYQKLEPRRDTLDGGYSDDLSSVSLSLGGRAVAVEQLNETAGSKCNLFNDGVSLASALAPSGCAAGPPSPVNDRYLAVLNDALSTVRQQNSVGRSPSTPLSSQPPAAAARSASSDSLGGGGGGGAALQSHTTRSKPLTFSEAVEIHDSLSHQTANNRTNRPKSTEVVSSRQVTV